MGNKTYLPVWTDGLSYDEQHLVYWIANNMERIDPRYSFLPMRMLGEFFCGRKSIFLVRLIHDYIQKGPCRVDCEITPLSYYVAEKAFDLAAEEFLATYPEAQLVSFGELQCNGVYVTEFVMDYQRRLTVFREILDKQIEKTCVVDESFEYSQQNPENRIPWPEYNIKALMDIDEDELIEDCAETLKSYGFPYTPQKQVKVKKEEVYKHYSTIPEKMLLLGNQYIKYNQNAIDLASFFNAARARDIALIRKYVSAGVDINSINRDGMTALCMYIGSTADTKKPYAIADLKEMIRMGANPAIYGAGFDEDPLSSECLCRSFTTISFLLECGVSPHIYPCIDEPGEYMAETLLERTERWSEGEPLVNAGPDEDMKRILTMLQEYA